MPALNKLLHSRIAGLGPGKHSDGGGLWLHKREDGGAQWFLRVTVHGKRREMGLGALSDVPLKQARLRAEKWRAVARDGLDPIKERDRERREAARAETTLAALAVDAFEARKSQLKGDGTAGRWFSPLELHILPRLGKTPVEELTQQDIRDTLKPIWDEKADTARKAINRLNIVLKHAAALGLDVDLQATEKAKALLGRTRYEARNIPALHWRDVPDFYGTLAEPTITHLALRLLILTGIRSRPVRFIREDELAGDVWTIPAENMKGLRGETADFRVPLSAEAQTVIEAARPFARGGFLFPSARKGVISDATMSRHMERRGMEERPHGFRSSLRTWLADATDAPEEVAKTILGHSVGSDVDKAYRRTDFLEQRRALMERWAGHVTGGSGRVVRIA